MRLVQLKKLSICCVGVGATRSCVGVTLKRRTRLIERTGCDYHLSSNGASASSTTERTLVLKGVWSGGRLRPLPLLLILITRALMFDVVKEMRKCVSVNTVSLSVKLLQNLLGAARLRRCHDQRRILCDIYVILFIGLGLCLASPAECSVRSIVPVSASLVISLPRSVI